jgi:flagellar biosynthesis protein FlhG
MMEGRIVTEQESQEKGGGYSRSFRVIAVTSGKGGVGKTNIVANLGITLAQDGRKVLILDADIGLANVEVVMGITPKLDLRHVLMDGGNIEDCIVEAPGDVDLLSGSNGAIEMAELDSNQKWRLLEALEPLSARYDTLLIDTSAGIGSNVQFFAGAAQEVIVVVGPEPPSLTDAYSVIKALANRTGMSRVLVCVNQTTSIGGAREVFGRLFKVTSQFLNVVVEFVGWIPHDISVEQAVMKQSPFVLAFPMSPAAQGIKTLAESLLRRQPQAGSSSGFHMFWQKLLQAEEFTA